MTGRGALLIAMCLCAVQTGAAGGLAPLSHYHDLVAGTGVAGFENGEFYRACFNGPMGLAVLEKRGLLAVSDRGNNRIRAVRLNDRNRVETLAGSGAKGRADGPLQKASFDGPVSLVAVSDRSLIVNDSGNHVFRLIDLAKGSVETVASSGAAVSLGDVWSMVYVPAENAIYFTEPELHTLRRLDLASRRVATVLKDDPRIPRPAALALADRRLYVADRDGHVFELQTPVPAGSPNRPRMTPFADGKRILAMSARGKRVYALQLDPDPAWYSLSSKSPVVVPSAWGAPSPWPYLRFTVDEPVGIVPDPREGGSFFMASTSFHAVLGLKDYRFEDLSDSNAIANNGLVDFEYPTKKPERTFRILLLGDSRMNVFEVSPEAEQRGEPYPLRMASVPKQLELMLETYASLENASLRYEVLSLNRVSWEPLLVWPNYEAAAVVKTFDIDLVLLMLPHATSTVEAYIQRPITAGGIPARAIDAEHLLEPLADRLRGNPARAFVEGCAALGLGDPATSDFGSWEKCGTPPASPLRKELLALLGRPLRGIRDSLKGSRPDGKTPPLQVCYFAVGPRGTGVPERGFWKELCQAQRIAWLDLLDPLTVVAEAWHPLTGRPESAHWSEKGHAVFAFVLAHELIGRGIVPLARPNTAGRALAAALVLLAVWGLWMAARGVRRLRARPAMRK